MSGGKNNNIVSRGHVPPWELGQLQESDEDDAAGALKNVVVHPTPASVDKTSANDIRPHLFQKKVSGIMRKFSVGVREANYDHKISGAEPERSRRKTLHELAPGTGNLHNVSQPSVAAIQKNSKDHVRGEDRKISNESVDGQTISKQHEPPRQRRVSSALHRISREPSASVAEPHHRRQSLWALHGNKLPDRFGNITRHNQHPAGPRPPDAPSSGTGSRKISRVHERNVVENDLDPGGLTELLRALDTVHDRLRGPSHIHGVNTISDASRNFVPPNVNHAEGSSTVQQINFIGMRPVVNPASSNTSAIAVGTSKLKRRRKVGVFNPDFDFVNPSLQKHVGDAVHKISGENEKKADRERKIREEEPQSE